MTTPYFKPHELDGVSTSDLATIRQRHARRWEALIRKECKRLKKVEVAFVDKNWEAPKVPGQKIRVETSKPDFSGHLADGRHVVFEAKTTLHPTRFDFSNISKGQRQHLDYADTCGAMAFVYLLDNMRRRWVLPWWFVLSMESVCEKSSFPLPESPHFNTNDSSFQKKNKETWVDTYRRVSR